MKHLSTYVSSKFCAFGFLLLILSSCDSRIQEPIVNQTKKTKPSPASAPSMEPDKICTEDPSNTWKNGRCYSKEGMRCEAAGDYWTTRNICISLAQKKCEDSKGKWLEARCLSPDRVACETGGSNLKWDNTSKSCEYKRIIDYCLDPSLPEDITLTIQVIKNLYIGQTCEEIETKLRLASDLHILNSKGVKITNLSPLSAYTNLKNISLREQNIENLTPLSSLINLENLDLSDNQIEDLTPIAKLGKLSNLILDKNLIRNLTPLTQLSHLKLLSLQNNKIETVEVLGSADLRANGVFSNLEILDLKGNCGLQDISPLDFELHLINLDVTNTSVPLSKIPNRFKGKNSNSGYEILAKNQNEESTCE